MVGHGTVEIQIREELLLPLHHRIDPLGHRHQLLTLGVLLRQLGRPAFDHVGPRVTVLIDPVTKPHDLLLLGQHLEKSLLRLLRIWKPLDQLHRRLIGTPVKRPAEGPDPAGHGRVKVRQSGGNRPGRKGGGVELVLRVQNQRYIHRPTLKIGRSLAVQLVKERSGHRVLLIGVRQLLFLMGVEIPGQQHRPKAGRQPVRHRFAVPILTLRFQTSQHRATRPQDIHRMGIGRNLFQHRDKIRRQFSQRDQLALVLLQLSGVRQGAMDQKVGYLLKGRLLRKLSQPVAPVLQPSPAFTLVDDRHGGLPRHDPGQSF